MEQKIKALKTIHLAICAGTILAYIILGDTVIDMMKFPVINAESVVYLVIPIMAILVGTSLFRTQLKKADKQLKIEDNLGVYQSASIIRWAILEGAALLILFLKPDFIIIGILVIIYLISLRPTEDRIKRDLQYFG